MPRRYTDFLNQELGGQSTVLFASCGIPISQEERSGRKRDRRPVLRRDTDTAAQGHPRCDSCKDHSPCRYSGATVPRPRFASVPALALARQLLQRGRRKTWSGGCHIRGTDGSNPPPSSGESANFLSLSVMTPSLAARARCPARTERAHIARRQHVDRHPRNVSSADAN